MDTTNHTTKTAYVWGSDRVGYIIGLVDSQPRRCIVRGTYPKQTLDILRNVGYNIINKKWSLK